MAVELLLSTNEINAHLNKITIDNTDNATSLNTGSLVINGGQSINKDLRIGGDAYVTGTIYTSNLVFESESIIPATDESTSTSTGALIVAGGVGIAKNVNIGNNLNVNGTIYGNLFTSTINSTSISSGSFIVNGGLGVAKSLFANDLTLTSTNGSLSLNGGAIVNKTLNTNDLIVNNTSNLNNLVVNSTTNSLNTITGSLIVSGGACVAKNLNVGGEIIAPVFRGLVDISGSTNESTSTSTGAVIINGGCGIKGNGYIGGNGNVNGVLSANAGNFTNNISGGSLIINGNSTTIGNSNISGSLSLNGGATIGNNSQINGNLIINGVLTTNNINISSLYLSDSSLSSNASTGALQVNGGVGIGGNVFIGGGMGSTALNTGALIVNGGISTNNNLNVSGYSKILSTLESTNTNSGSLVVNGGAGIKGNIYVGGTISGFSASLSNGLNCNGGITTDILNSTNNTNSTSSSSGSVIINGGVGIGRDLNVGGSIYSTTQSFGDNTTKVATDAFVQNEFKTRSDVTYAPNGFENQTDSTLSYNVGTRTFTITPVGSYNVWVKGKRYTYNNPISLQHNSPVGLYFYYFNESGLNVSSSPPSFYTAAYCSVVYYYNASTAVCTEERHGTIMDIATHIELHNRIGTYLISGLTASNYVLKPSSPINSNNQFTLTSGIISDETLNTNINSLAAGSYNVNRLVGTSADWAFSTLTVPYNYNAGGFIQYNNFLAGSWVLSEVPNNNFVCYYVCVVPEINGNGIFIKPSNFYYPTLQEASAENFASNVVSPYVTPEMLVLYKIIFSTSSSYTTLGKCRIEQFDKIITNAVSITNAAVTNHGSLTGLQLADNGVTWGHISDQSQSIYGIKTFANTLDSTSTSTGALIINGGIGISKNANVGNNLIIGNNLNVINDFYAANNQIRLTQLAGESYIQSTGLLKFTPLFSGTSSLSISAVNVTIPLTIQSTNSLTGALIVNGGVAIGKKLNVNGGVNMFANTNRLTGSYNDNALMLGSTIQSSTTSLNDPVYLSYITRDTDGSFFSPAMRTGISQYLFDGASAHTRVDIDLMDGSSDSGWKNSCKLYGNGNVILSGTLNSTSTSTGALIVNGGVGVGGNLNIVGVISSNSNIDAIGKRLRITTDSVDNFIQSSNGTSGWLPLKFSSIGTSTPSFLTINSTNITIPTSTQSSSTSTGALIVSGGVGCGGNLNVGGRTTILNTNTTITGNSVQVGASSQSWYSNDSSESNIILIGRGTDAAGIGIHKSTLSVVNDYAYTNDINIGASIGLHGRSYDFGGGNKIMEYSRISGREKTGTSYRGQFNVEVIDSGSLVNIITATSTGVRIGDVGRVVPSNTLEVNGTFNVSGISSLTNTTQSNNTATGALIVNGGVGIAKNVYIGGIVRVSNQSSSSALSQIILQPILAGSNYIGSTLGVENSGANCFITRFYNIGGLGSLSNYADMGIWDANGAGSGGLRLSANGLVTVQGVSQSTSTTTGALIVNGGVGIAKNLFVGGSITTNNIYTYNSGNIACVFSGSALSSSLTTQLYVQKVGYIYTLSIITGIAGTTNAGTNLIMTSDIGLSSELRPLVNHNCSISLQIDTNYYNANVKINQSNGVLVITILGTISASQSIGINTCVNYIGY